MSGARVQGHDVRPSPVAQAVCAPLPTGRARHKDLAVERNHREPISVVLRGGAVTPQQVAKAVAGGAGSPKLSALALAA